MNSPDTTASLHRLGGLTGGICRSPSIADLWHSTEAHAWEQALPRYWDFVRPANLELERAMETLGLDRIRRMDAPGWYHSLLDEYFRWKYTAANRYATTTRHLRRYAETGTLDALHRIKERLLTIDRTDVRRALSIADEIRGLGIAGASGLLSLMYSDTFATVDQFVVTALRGVRDLPEHAAVARMNPEGLTMQDAVLLIGIMQRKAVENSRRFGTAWTPRKVDKVLWTYGR